MKKYIFSDLAMENQTNIDAKTMENIGNTSPEITHISEYITKIQVTLKNEQEAKSYGKRAGTYLTFSTQRLWETDNETFDLLEKNIAKELRKMILSALRRDRLDSSVSVLVVGLGNPMLTSDALGAETVRRVNVTRGLKSGGIKNKVGCSVSALATDVVGNTGIETSEHISSCAKCVGAQILIVVDALAARSCKNLGSAIQLTDTGISPGSGIGRNNKSVDKESVGADVISIGIPTVINSSTMIADLLQTNGIADTSCELEMVLKNNLDFFVSPKESDLLLKYSAIILSGAINLALRGE